MPLVKRNLVLQLSTFLDNKSPYYIAAPANMADAATKWTNALHAYMSTVSPPSPTIIAAANGAKAVMYAAMISAMTTNTFHVLLPTILMAYAGTLALGFAPTYIAVPPVTPPLIPAAFAVAQAGGTSSIFIETFATVVDVWMHTGVATLVTPAGPGPPIPWF